MKMKEDGLQKALETMRLSMNNSVMDWFSEILTMNAEDDIDVSALSTAVDLKLHRDYKR